MGNPQMMGWKRNEAEIPWTSIQVLDGIPARAHLEIQDRVGPILIKLTGPVPPDLLIYVSENYQDSSEASATWTFSKRHKFMLFPKDQRLLRNPKKDRQLDRNEKFLSEILYFVFDTTSSEENDHLNAEGLFHVQVRFLSEEKHQKRLLKARDLLE